MNGPRKPVSLRAVVDGLDELDDAAHGWCDLRTGECSVIHDDQADLDEVEALAESLDASAHHVMLPPADDFGEPAVVRDFIAAQDDPAARDALREAFAGRGAFRRYKDTVHRLGLREQWFAWREAALAAWARRWLEAIGVPWFEDLADDRDCDA